MKWTWPGVWEGERGGWWRVAVTMVLWYAGLVGGMLLVTAIMIQLRGFLKNEPEYVAQIVRLLVGGPVQHGLMLAGCLIGVRFVHRKPVASVLTDGRRFQFALAFESAGLWILLWLAGTICLPDGWANLLARAGQVPPGWWPVLAAVTFGAITLQATQEEVVWRGYLLTRIAAWVQRPWLATVIVSVVFTAIHVHASPPAMAAIAFVAITLCAGCIRAGTLAPLIGMHAAHNALQTLWNPGGRNAGATWPEAAAFAIQLVIWFGWLLWATRGSDRQGQPECIPPGSA